MTTCLEARCKTAKLSPNDNMISGFLSEKGSMSQILSRSLSPARRLLHGRRKDHHHLSSYDATHVRVSRIKATGTSRNLHLAFSTVFLPTFKGPDVDGRGRGDREGRRRATPRKSISSPKKEDLESALFLCFEGLVIVVAPLLVGRRLRNEILFLFCVRRPPNRADEQKKTG